LHLIEGLKAEGVREQLRRSRADLAVIILQAVSGKLEQSHLSAVSSACLECPVIAVVPEVAPQQSLALLEAGASDFVFTPVRAADLVPRVVRWIQPREPEEVFVGRLKQAMGSCQILSRNPAMLAQLARLPLVAGCDATVLISGETGTGKELFAHAVHYLSRRASGPFVAVNCGAIPAELIENELFGHEAGAYTTASTPQAGLLQEAGEGSLFLDEIDTLPLSLQVKLLRFLQDKEYRPLGSSKPRRADVRMIAASNVSLEDAMGAGRLRQDLFYRLSVLSIDLPPLRERPEDIPLLARHFLEKYATEFSRPARALSPGAIRTLQSHAWPGNVRELENVIQRAVLLGETSTVDAHQLNLQSRPCASAGTSFKDLKSQAVQDFERHYLTDLLRAHEGNISAAARAAGKNRRAFWELLRKHQLIPPHAPPGSDSRKSTRRGPLPSAPPSS